MPVIPVNKVVGKKNNNWKKRAEEEKNLGSMTHKRGGDKVSFSFARSKH
jgi:hypothetical protein